jgi:hypothetical protein
MNLDKDDLAVLCKEMTKDEVDRVHRLLHEWSVGPDTSFPVQLALLTCAQLRVAASLPRSITDGRKWLELHLAEYRRQTAELVKDFSAVGEGQADELKNVVKAHTEALNQASGSFHSQLKSIGAFTQDIRKHLDDGISSYNHIKTDLKAGGEMFRKTCIDLDGRINGVQLRRDWLAWLGLIAIGMVIGVTIGVVLEAKLH